MNNYCKPKSKHLPDKTQKVKCVFSRCDSRCSGSRALLGLPMYNILTADRQVHRTERRMLSCLLHTSPKVKRTLVVRTLVVIVTFLRKTSLITFFQKQGCSNLYWRTAFHNLHLLLKKVLLKLPIKYRGLLWQPHEIFQYTHCVKYTRVQ
jgi:hypothetical protein